MSSVTVGDYLCGPGQPLLLIAGPCVLQSLDLALQIAEPLAQHNERPDVNVVFKGSFDKANRTSLPCFGLLRTQQSASGREVMREIAAALR